MGTLYLPTEEKWNHKRLFYVMGKQSIQTGELETEYVLFCIAKRSKCGLLASKLFMFSDVEVC